VDVEEDVVINTYGAADKAASTMKNIIKSVAFCQNLCYHSYRKIRRKRGVCLKLASQRKRATG